VKGGAPIFHLDNFGEMSGILDSSGVESEWD